VDTDPKYGAGKARILMIDDHPIVREGMAQFLNLQDNLHLCCQAYRAAEALDAKAAGRDRRGGGAI
jgi:DNA-binding NarL/FixJ family response regulator